MYGRYSVIQDIYSDYQKKVNEYSKNKRSRIEEKKLVEQKEIENAIALLKAMKSSFLIRTFFKKM